MDGFHYDDRMLVPRGLRARKGAPETFDVGGFADLLTRLKANAEDEVAIPVFDRELEIARAGARAIERSVRHIIVEGNYLLHDNRPWRDLARVFDTTIAVASDIDELRRRLEARWAGYGLEVAEIARKVEENDLPNARVVISRSVEPEFWLAGDFERA
jgi:pantothenate kinase